MTVILCVEIDYVKHRDVCESPYPASLYLDLAFTYPATPWHCRWSSPSLLLSSQHSFHVTGIISTGHCRQMSSRVFLSQLLCGTLSASANATLSRTASGRSNPPYDGEGLLSLYAIPQKSDHLEPSPTCWKFKSFSGLFTVDCFPSISSFSNP